MDHYALAQLNTTFQTHEVEAIGSPNAPTLVGKAGDLAMNVLVRNASAVPVFLAPNETDLVPVPTSASYRMGIDSSEVFYLAPKQSLFAIAPGTGAVISTSMSPFAEPIPVPRPA